MYVGFFVNFINFCSYAFVYSVCFYISWPLSLYTLCCIIYFTSIIWSRDGISELYMMLLELLQTLLEQNWIRSHIMHCSLPFCSFPLFFSWVMCTVSCLTDLVMICSPLILRFWCHHWSGSGSSFQIQIKIFFHCLSALHP